MNKGLVLAGSILLAIAPLILVAGVYYTVMRPNIYASRVVISVSPGTLTDPLPSGSNSHPAYDPVFLRTQMELIQSTPVFDSVVRRLNLQEEWGIDGNRMPQEVVVRILRNSIRVVLHRDTTLLSVICRRPDPYEAARIANEMAEAFRDSQMDREQRMMIQRLDRLDEALSAQWARIEATEAKVGQLREALDVALVRGERNIEVEALRSEQVVLQNRIFETEALLQVVKQLEGHNAVEIAKRLKDDALIGNLLRQWDDIEAELDNQSGSDPAVHPEVARLENQKRLVEEALEEHLEYLRERALEACKQAFARDDELYQLIATSLQEAGENPEPVLALRMAMHDLENERLLYDQINERIRKQITALDRPQLVVEIVDIAEPVRRPVSPDLFLNVVLAAVAAGVVAMAGVILLLVGLRRKAVPQSVSV